VPPHGGEHPRQLIPIHIVQGVGGAYGGVELATEVEVAEVTAGEAHPGPPAGLRPRGLQYSLTCVQPDHLAGTGRQLSSQEAGAAGEVQNRPQFDPATAGEVAEEGG
jgi:hypothetical protein